MSAIIDVRELAPASSVRTRWLVNMVGEAGAACRFKKGLPGVDISPLNGIGSPYAGIVLGHITRWSVGLSIKSVFWRRETMIAVYLHECSHLLVFEQRRLRNLWTAAHGPVFFLIQLVLYHRVDSTRKYSFNLVCRSTLYDFADNPFDLNGTMSEWEWRSVVLAFGLKNYRQLAESNLSAEAVAEEAFNLWDLEVQGLDAEKQANAEQSVKLACLEAQIGELEHQRSASFAWRFLFSTGWAGVITLGVLAGGILACGVFALGYGLGLHRVFA